MKMALCVRLPTIVLWFPASALMWSGHCGFRGQTGATAGWFGIFFPSGSQQDVFNEPQHVWTVASHHTRNPALIVGVHNKKKGETQWNEKHARKKKTEHVSNTGNAASETKTTNQMLVITVGNVWAIYHRGFKSPRPSCSCCAGASVSPPHRTHLHVTFDAASRSHHSQQFSEVCSSLLIYFWGFLKKEKKSKHRCLPQATDGWEWPGLISSCQCVECTCCVHKMVLLAYRITNRSRNAARFGSDREQTELTSFSR